MRIPGKIKHRIAPKIPLSVYQQIFRNEPLGLVYHVVSDEKLPYVEHLYPFKTKAFFEQDLVFLKKNTNLVSYNQIVSNMNGDKAFSTKSVFLSFDDGYKECFSVVRPLLNEQDIPCIFFITTDFIDNKKVFFRNKVSWCVDQIQTMETDEIQEFISIANDSFGKKFEGKVDFGDWIMSLPRKKEDTIDGVAELLGLNWSTLIEKHRPFMKTEEIKELVSDGFVVGAHTCSHARFNQISPQQTAHEIQASCQIIKEITGARKVPFAFPFSSAGADWQTISDLRKNLDFLGLIFDSRGMYRNKPNFVNRVWADPPEGSTKTQSNIKNLLQNAYKEYVLSS